MMLPAWQRLAFIPLGPSSESTLGKGTGMHERAYRLPRTHTLTPCRALLSPSGALATLSRGTAAMCGWHGGQSTILVARGVGTDLKVSFSHNFFSFVFLLATCFAFLKDQSTNFAAVAVLGIAVAVARVVLAVARNAVVVAAAVVAL